MPQRPSRRAARRPILNIVTALIRALLVPVLLQAPLGAWAGTVTRVPEIAAPIVVASVAAPRLACEGLGPALIPQAQLQASIPEVPAVGPAPALAAAVPGVPVAVPAFKDDAFVAPAHSHPSELLVSARNFEVAEKPEDPSDTLDKMLEIKDPEKRKRLIQLSRPLTAVEIQLALLRANPGMSDAESKALAQDASAKLKAHFGAVLSRHPHTLVSGDGADSYRIEDGLAFWVDFASAQDPVTRAAVSAFLGESARRIYAKDFAYNLVAALIQSERAVTRIIDGGALSPSDRDALARLARERGLDLSRHGRYVLIGGGASFHLLRELLLEARELKDPMLAQRLDKVLMFLSRKGVLIDHDSHLAAAAFYHPLDDRLAFVMPSRADLNVLSHEGTHARFKRFEDAMESWLKAKGYALPYETDGPRNALIGNGGYMSLLNELNSWRLGESFDGGKSDGEILQILRDSYGRQAGMQAAADFGKLWPEERVRGKSVPALIRASALALNKRSDAELPAMGYRALASSDGTSQRDFLRVLRARLRGRDLPPALRFLAERLSRFGVDEAVREQAADLLKPQEEAAQPGSRTAQRKSWRAFSKEAGAWLDSFKSDEIKIVPSDVSWSAAELLKLARDEKIFSYDETLARLTARFGADRDGGARMRAGFNAVNAAAGATWDEKLRSYLTAFNARGFAALWAEFAKNPSYDLRELLSEKHAMSFTPADVARLARWSAESGVNEDLRSGAVSLLADVLSARGLDTLYPDSELKSLTAMQKAMNKKNGVPEDAHVPRNRAPRSGDPYLEALDLALASVMFDAKPGIHRLKAIELAVGRTYPGELPRLRARVEAAITADDAHKYDQWVARMFLVPADAILFHPQTRWGRAIASAVLADKHPKPTALEFVGEYVRTSAGLALGGPVWGKSGEVRLDAAARAAALEADAKLSGEAAQERDWAAGALWSLLPHADRKVAKSALYALAAHPVLMLAVEGRLAAELDRPGSPYRNAAIKLLAMSRPGYSPILDAALARLAPTPEEAALLALRPAGAS